MATLRESYPSHRPEDVIPGWRPEEGLPPTGFGDKPWREEMAGLEEESAAIRAEREEILTRIKGKYTPEQISAAKERLAARRRPPEGFQVPEFSDAGRHRYEQGVFRQIQENFRIPGGNPFKINPMDAVDEAMSTQLPQLFQQVFGGQILFSDADKLEGKWLKYWNEQVLKFKADVSKKAKFAIKRAEAYHAYAMSKYDTERKAVEGRKEQIEKEKLRQIMTAPQARVNNKGERTWHEWDETLQKWEDTGKLVKEEKEEKPEYKAGQALEKIAAAQKAKASFNKTGKIDAIMAKMFPEYTEGQKLSKTEISKVNKAYDRLIKHLQGFAPEVSKRDQAIEQLQAAGQPVTEANIDYVMGQL